MHSLETSHCAICRHPYNHFPSICQQLHCLIAKLEPAAFRRREKEVLEEERLSEVYSPQFQFPNISASEDSYDKMWKEEDLLCSLCGELLYRPSVLNCGHVFCEPCISSQPDEPLKCHLCRCVHPGKFHSVCLDLDQFIQDNFPDYYASKQEKMLIKVPQQARETSSKQSNNARLSPSTSSLLRNVGEDVPNVHVGVGCDFCGMYPIVGKRYRCKDCPEQIGFDLCEACLEHNNTSTQLNGRFNQQHTADHHMELDDSQLLSRLRLRAVEDADGMEIVYLGRFVVVADDENAAAEGNGAMVLVPDGEDLAAEGNGAMVLVPDGEDLAAEGNDGEEHEAEEH